MVTKEQKEALAAKYGGKAEDYDGYVAGDVRGGDLKFSRQSSVSLSLAVLPPSDPRDVRIAALEKENAELRSQVAPKAEAKSKG